MYTTDVLNQELEKYCAYMQCTLPLVKHVRGCSIQNANARFIPNEPVADEYTIELSSSFYDMDVQNQQATLWHEFTHLYDWHFYNIPKEQKYIIMYTYSEAHATEIQYRKLLALNTTQTIGKEIRFLRNTSKQQYKQTVAELLLQTKEAFQKLQEHKSSDMLTEFIRCLSYYCGCCLLFNSKLQKEYIGTLQCISRKYKSCILDYACAIISRDYNSILAERDKLLNIVMFH